MQFDFSKLEGRIVEKFGTRRDFAEGMGLTPQQLHYRLTSVVSFKMTEVVKACDLLDIESDQVVAYFFNRKVR